MENVNVNQIFKGKIVTYVKMIFGVTNLVVKNVNTIVTEMEP